MSSRILGKRLRRCSMGEALVETFWEFPSDRSGLGLPLLSGALGVGCHVASECANLVLHRLEGLLNFRPFLGYSPYRTDYPGAVLLACHSFLL